MAVNIKSARVDELLEQLRALTGQGPTEIVLQALDQELQRQRRLRRSSRLENELPDLQARASAAARPFDPESLYEADGLPALSRTRP